MREPVFLPSKGRADVALTPDVLDALGVPYRLIVEEPELDAYRARWGDRVLVLPRSFQEDYDTTDELGMTKPLGPGPARNYAWHLAQQEGAAWHWVMDDNIRAFYRFNRNRRIQVADDGMFRAMAEFVQRYTNVAMAGPDYVMFTPSKLARPPFRTGTRIYSCNLIRTSLPFRWRCRYNEDTDLSLRMLKAGYATVSFSAFLQEKVRTQRLGGGNTAAFYESEGTIPKTAQLIATHPDVTRATMRFGRAHHFVDYGQWRGQPLIRDESWTPTAYADHVEWPEGHPLSS